MRFEELPDGFYWVTNGRDSDTCLVRLYKPNDTEERGIGFGIWDGYGFVPLSHLTNDTNLHAITLSNPPEGKGLSK